MYIANKQEITVRIDSDVSTCNIEDVCLLAYGSILVSDTVNAVVKLLDSSFNVRTKYRPPDSPYGVCSIDDDQAAVALNNQTIEILSVGEEIVRTSVISLGHCCYSIAHHKGNLYITNPGNNCLLSNGIVYVYSVSGDRLQVIDKDLTGRDIFSRPCHIGVSSCGKEIHVADLDFGLVSVDEHCKVSQVKPRVIEAAIGMCLIDDNNILVSGLRSHNVIQVDTRDSNDLDDPTVTDIVPSSADNIDEDDLDVEEEVTSEDGDGEDADEVDDDNDDGEVYDEDNDLDNLEEDEGEEVSNLKLLQRQSDVLADEECNEGAEEEEKLENTEEDTSFNQIEDDIARGTKRKHDDEVEE